MVTLLSWVGVKEIELDRVPIAKVHVIHIEKKIMQNGCTVEHRWRQGRAMMLDGWKIMSNNWCKLKYLAKVNSLKVK